MTLSQLIQQNLETALKHLSFFRLNLMTLKVFVSTFRQMLKFKWNTVEPLLYGGRGAMLGIRGFNVNNFNEWLVSPTYFAPEKCAG